MRSLMTLMRAMRYGIAIGGDIVNGAIMLVMRPRIERLRLMVLALKLLAMKLLRLILMRLLILPVMLGLWAKFWREKVV